MFTALAPQRERIFSFFIVFRLSETSFFVFFLLFFLAWCWLGGVGGGGGVGGVITFFGLEHIWDVMSWDLFLEFNTSGMVRHEIFSWNSTHLGWYVMRSFLGIRHILDGTLWDLFLEFNTSGMVRHEIFSWNSTHLGWYVMRSFPGIQHIWDGTSWDLFLEFNTSGMVRHEIFSWNSTHLGWYVMRSFLGIQHIWDGTSWDLCLEFNTSGMVRHEIFSWNSTHLGWYVMRSFLGIQHIWDGTSWETMHFLERIQARFSSNCLDFLQIKENLANMRWMKIKVIHWSKHTWKCLNWSSFFSTSKYDTPRYKHGHVKLHMHFEWPAWRICHITTHTFVSKLRWKCTKPYGHLWAPDLVVISIINHSYWTYKPTSLSRGPHIVVMAWEAPRNKGYQWTPGGGPCQLFPTVLHTLFGEGFL